MADPKDFSNKQIVKQSQLGVPIGNKTILGQLTTYNDGSAKWTYGPDINPLISGPGDRSTFTLYKQDDGKWSWTPTTATSLPNLSSREGIDQQAIINSLYRDKAPASAVLNAGNVTQLGGINSAKKFGVPGTTGQAVVTGPLPSTIGGVSPVTAQSDTSPDETQSSQNVGPQPPGVGQDASIGPDTGLGEKLIYPEDLNGTQQDYIIFTMVETNPRALGEGDNPFVIGKRTNNTKKSLGTVTLPIQSGIIDTNTVGWGQDDLDPLSIAGAKIFRDGALKGLGTVGGNVANATATAAGNPEDIKKGVVNWLMSEALNKDPSALLSRTTGAIINPNVELLFNGVSLRAFNFTFKMSARTEKEAKIIKKIIYFFKKGMAAKQTKSGFFLKKPYTFEIEYKHKNQTHPGMNLIKQCALQNFGVNYTSDAQYAVHSDGNLTSYEISMQFTELDPLYFDDYDGTHPIGY